MVVVLTVKGVVVTVVVVVDDDVVICDDTVDDCDEVLDVDVVEIVVLEDEVDELVIDDPLIVVEDDDDDEGIVEVADEVFEVNVDWEFKLVKDTTVDVVPVEFNVDPELLVDVKPDPVDIVVEPVGIDPVDDDAVERYMF